MWIKCSERVVCKADSTPRGRRDHFLGPVGLLPARRAGCPAVQSLARRVRLPRWPALPADLPCLREADRGRRRRLSHLPRGLLQSSAVPSGADGTGIRPAARRGGCGATIRPDRGRESSLPPSRLSSPQRGPELIPPPAAAEPSTKRKDDSADQLTVAPPDASSWLSCPLPPPRPNGATIPGSSRD